VTALSTLPFAIGLVESVYYASTRFPTWLVWLLWITYGGAMYGLLRAWYVPYLLVEEPARVTRYKKMFSHTHACSDAQRNRTEHAPRDLPRGPHCDCNLARIPNVPSRLRLMLFVAECVG
jgi:hypothetical protein